VDVAVDLLFTLIGLGLLVKAADVFVDASAGLSLQLKIPPVVVGAVVIGLGTSVPEVLVSSFAAAGGDAALGVGNIVGSNIANLSLVLGVAALLSRVEVGRGTLRREVPLSVGAVVAFGIVVRAGLPVAGGIALLVALGVLLVLAARTRGGAADEELAEEVEELEAESRQQPTSRLGLVAFAGLVGTAIGAQLVVTGSTGIAAASGLSQGLVGLTLVAVGTSLPEMVTAVHAARRGQHELVLGNVLGSNVFNSLLAGGLVAVLAPGQLDDQLLATRGVMAMVAVSLVAWVMMARWRGVGRVGAVVLLAGYAIAVVVTT
jgi:cation:H+ antiporter